METFHSSVKQQLLSKYGRAGPRTCSMDDKSNKHDIGCILAFWHPFFHVLTKTEVLQSVRHGGYVVGICVDYEQVSSLANKSAFRGMGITINKDKQGYTITWAQGDHLPSKITRSWDSIVQDMSQHGFVLIATHTLDSLYTQPKPLCDLERLPAFIHRSFVFQKRS